MRASFRYFVDRQNDRLKAALFMKPIRWHVSDLDQVWREKEVEIARTVERMASDYRSAEQVIPFLFPRYLSGSTRCVLGDLYFVYVNSFLPRLLRQVGVIINALAGKREAWARTSSSVQRRLQIR
jgi:hypothetical protein